MDALSPKQCWEHITDILTDDQYEEFIENKSIDFCAEFGDAGRTRVNIFRHRNGIAGAFRIIPQEVPKIEELGLPPQVADLIKHERGLVLITGPSGCGKTTTLASLIHLINETTNDHVISLEDPIEYVIPSKRGFITQREVRTHSKSFAKALHAALREDPDIIVVSDLLDPESVSTAITAA